MSRITDYPVKAVPAFADTLLLVDAEDLTQSSLGSTKQTTVGNLRSATVPLDWINVKQDYGAYGDNSHDDTAAIQNALTNAKAGQVIYLPIGVYPISSPLIFPARAVSLRGTLGAMQGGSGSPGLGSLLKVSGLWSQGSAISNAVLQIGQAARHDIQDIWIFGNNNTGTGIDAIADPYTSGGGHTISRVGINNMSGWGINFGTVGPLGVDVETVIIQQCGYGGVNIRVADTYWRNVHTQTLTVNPVQTPAVPASGTQAPNTYGMPVMVSIAPPVPFPSASSSGGTVANGEYGIAVAYTTSTGESIVSGTYTIAASSSPANTNSITVPAPPTVNGATGWYAYFTQAGGSSLTRQQAPGSPLALGTPFVLTAPPGSAGAAPVTANPVTQVLLGATGQSGSDTHNTAGPWIVGVGNAITMSFSSIPFWFWSAAQNGWEIHDGDTRLEGCRADLANGRGFMVSPVATGARVNLGVGCVLTGCCTEDNDMESLYVSGGGAGYYGPVQAVGCQFTGDSSAGPGMFPAVHAVGRVSVSLTDVNIACPQASYALQTGPNLGTQAVPDSVTARGGYWQAQNGLVSNNGASQLLINPDVTGVLGFINGNGGTTPYQAALPAPWVNGSNAGLYGYAAWSFDQSDTAANNGLLLNGSVPYLTQLYITQPILISTLYWLVKTAGAGPSAGDNWAGMFGPDGSLDASANIDSLVTSGGLQSVTFSSPLLLTPGRWWTAFLFNAATCPVLLGKANSNGGLLNAGLSPSQYRSATNGSGRSTLPGSISLASNANQGQLLWAAVA